jgi:hypothetical protein
MASQQKQHWNMMQNPFVSMLICCKNPLRKKNNKPILVPFDLDFPVSMRGEILSHYAKMGYTNIWVDFKGKGFNNKNTIRKMRTFWRSANKLFDENSKNLIVYQTNLRRLPRGVLGDIRSHTNTNQLSLSLVYSGTSLTTLFVLVPKQAIVQAVIMFIHFCG